MEQSELTTNPLRSPALRRTATGAMIATLALLLAAGCGPGAGSSAGAGTGEPETTESTDRETTVDEREEHVHPDFEMSERDLLDLFGDAPEPVRAAVAERGQYFLELAAGLLELPASQLRLADKNHPLPEDAVPEDLVSLDHYRDRLTLNREGLRVRAVILPDVLAMVEAAAQEGVTLPISSTYRSYDYQADLFERHVDELGEEEAARVSARPGTSQHQLGTVIDFGSITPAFADTAAGRWMAHNAGRFGFSLSYPEDAEELTGYSYEPWHYRWIGRTAIEMEREFFAGSQQRFLEFWDAHAERLRERLR
ncbi:MAG: M15 family metallopeptidase [Spirochaetaceae bacterium]